MTEDTPDKLQYQAMLSQGLSAEKVMDEPDIEGYEIIQLLGQGGMSKVYLARELALGRLVALKVFNADAIDAICVERFYQEAQMMAQIQHPNIVSIYGQISCGEEIPCLVLEYVPGGDLRSKLSIEGAFSVQEAKRIAIDVCTGLEAIHAKQIVHRDINPANVLLDEEGKAKVADLGIALNQQTDKHSDGLTMTGTFVGTMAYLAPEQMTGSREDLDARTDVWAVGVLLYEMLVGVPPQGVLASDLLGDIHPSIKPIVRKCLRRNPADRYQDIVTLRRALEKKSTALTANHLLKYLWIGTSIIVIAGAAYWLSTRSDNTPPNESNTATKANAPANSAPVPSSGNPPSGLDEIDVLSELRSPQRPIRGRWDKRGDTLVSQPHSNGGILPLPVVSPGNNYNISFNITRRSGTNSVSVFLPTSIGMLNFDLDGWNNHFSGIQNLDGQDMRKHGKYFIFTIEQSVSYDLLIQVREHSISVSIDGKQRYHCDLQGHHGTLSEPWRADIGDRLAIGAWNSTIEFKNIKFKKIAP